MSNLLQIKKFLEKYNKTPKKSLGQNFLINPEIPKRTAELCMGEPCSPEGQKNAGVIEIGPGIGALTAELCKLFKKVVAVEIDRAFEPILNETLGGASNLKIVFGDILKIDLRDLVKQELSEFKEPGNIRVCANLPYYITSPVILKLIKSGLKFKSITVMVQKEAADKICAKAGEAHYNATSVTVGYYGEAKKAFNAAKSNFYPSPRVLSTVVNITPHEVPAAAPESEELMYRVIEAAFGQRRKTLVNALASGLDLDKDKVSDIIKEVLGGKNGNIRGEELDIKAFSDISDLIKKYT